MNRLVMICALLCGMTMFSAAQTVRWAIEPEFSKVVQVSENMYVAMRDGGVDIFDGKGVKHHSISGDVNTVSPFRNNFALLLNEENSIQEGKCYRLVAVLPDNINNSPMRVPVSDCFVYAYPFFNNGMLPVYRDGEYGYLAYRDGGLVMATEFKYQTALPFVNDVAYVVTSESGKSFKDKLLDKGKRLVNDYLKGDFSLDNAEPVDKTGKKKKDSSGWEVYFAAISDFDSISDIESFLGSDLSYRIEASEYRVSSSGGEEFGYSMDGKEILPDQFDDAKDFNKDGYAVASVQGHYGLLQLVPSETFACSQELHGEQSREGMESIRLALSCPESYSGKPLELYCRAEDGPWIKAERSEDSTEGKMYFDVTVPSGEKQVDVISDDIVLLRAFFEKLYYIAEVRLSGSQKVKANSSDKATATLTVQNVSDRALNLSIDSSSSLNMTLSQRSIKALAPGKSIRITASFTGVQSRGNATVSVRGEGVKPASISIQIDPFF